MIFDIQHNVNYMFMRFLFCLILILKYMLQKEASQHAALQCNGCLQIYSVSPDSDQHGSGIQHFISKTTHGSLETDNGQTSQQ